MSDNMQPGIAHRSVHLGELLLAERPTGKRCNRCVLGSCLKAKLKAKLSLPEVLGAGADSH